MRTLGSLLTLIALVGAAQAVCADDGCGAPDHCARCGRRTACQKVTCQVVCEMKKQTKYYWSVECQEICPLLPGCEGCSKDGCEGSAGRPPQKGPAPRCGHARCVKQLVKKQYECEVPVYKCVTRYLCGDCRGAEAAPPPAKGDKAAALPIPPAPVAPTAHTAYEPAPLPGLY